MIDDQALFARGRRDDVADRRGDLSGQGRPRRSSSPRRARGLLEASVPGSRPRSRSRWPRRGSRWCSRTQRDDDDGDDEEEFHARTQLCARDYRKRTAILRTP